MVTSECATLVMLTETLCADLSPGEDLLQKHRDAEIKEAEKHILVPARRILATTTSAAKQAQAAATEAASQSFHEDVQEIAEDFRPASSQLRERVNRLWEDSNYAGKDWDSPDWNDWSPDPSPEFATRIGTLSIADEDLTAQIPDVDFDFKLPALIPFAQGRCLLFSVTGAAKDAAAEALQSTVIRALANTPAGKARFTLIDPVGLGRNVADFMHLGDYNPELISGKAWTESQHIEQQLTKITEEMETVIQTFLRKNYVSIQEYNKEHREVAEPFRFLVIFDFPVNFTEDSARRLISIVKNGPRCGVFTLILMDATKKLPYGFDVADLKQSAVVITNQTMITRSQPLETPVPAPSHRQQSRDSKRPQIQTAVKDMIGKLYQGKVVEIKEFGAFVEILPDKVGLVHVSELADFRVRHVEDVCKLGDKIWVRCISVDEKGRVKLSRKAALSGKT